MWLKHAFDGFPRHVSTPWTRRVNVLNAHNYVYLGWKTYGQADMFTSIYPLSFVNFDAIMTLNKIFFDIDSSEPQIAYRSMQKIADYFVSNYGYTPRVNFSGKKGYHLYIDFEPINFRVEYFKEVVRKLIDRVMTESKAETVDNSAVGDEAGVTRVSRIPYSIHPKSGAVCVPIDPYWGLDEIKLLSEEGSGQDVTINLCPKIGDELLEMAIQIGEQRALAPPTPETIYEMPDEKILAQVGEKLFEIMEIAPNYYDGRHRMIWAMLVPRLTILKSNGRYQVLQGEELQRVNHEIKEGVKAFIEATPDTNPDGSMREPMQKYLDYTDLVLGRLYKQLWSPWNFETFWMEYPDLAKYFKKTTKDFGSNGVS